MAQKKVKYPKKPKASASAQVMENYLAKCKEVDKKNAEIKKEQDKKIALKKKIDAIKR